MKTQKQKITKSFNKRIAKARERAEKFSPRGSDCPICKKDFRYGCNHNVRQAEDRLQEEITKLVVQRELSLQNLT